MSTKEPSTKGPLAAAPEIVDDIRRIVTGRDTITALNEIRTLHRGPNDVLLALSLDYVDTVPAGEVERTNTELEMAIKKRFPVVKRLFLEVQSARDHQMEVERARKLRAEEN